MGATSQHIDLIKAGIDESFVRPIAPTKLISFLARHAAKPSEGPALAGGHHSLVYGDIEMDLEAHRVQRNGRQIHLGPIEYRILWHFMENAGQVCTREALIESAWQKGRFVDRRTVNVHIGRLRRALGTGGTDIIRTVRTAGYALERLEHKS